MKTNIIPLPARPPDAGKPESDVSATVLRMDERAVYTVTEVSRLLSLSRSSTYALVRDGTIPALKLGGRWVIPKKRFAAWLDSCREPSTVDGRHA